MDQKPRLKRIQTRWRPAGLILNRQVSPPPIVFLMDFVRCTGEAHQVSNRISQLTWVQSRTVALLIFFLTCCIWTHTAEARLNLPQVRQVIQLGDDAKAAAQDYFSRQLPHDGAELPASLQASLLRSLPENLASTCGILLEEWAGERGQSSSFWRVRLLHHQSHRVWLALRCGSRLQDMARYYDERLALLHLNTSSLELLPLGPDTEDDEGVYSLQFSKRLVLKNAEGFSFHVGIGNNPCCDGPESRSQERLIVFADTAHGTFESLSVITARDDSSHSDDPEIDTETTYRADVNFEHDSNSFVTAASAAFHETVKDITWESGKARAHTASERSGTLRFRWNPTIFKFEKIQ